MSLADFQRDEVDNGVKLDKQRAKSEKLYKGNKYYIELGKSLDRESKRRMEDDLIKE